jgi:hypothetical protein
MGTTPSKLNIDYNPVQHPEQGMREIGIPEYGIPLNKKIPVGGQFFIEAQRPNKNGIHTFYLHHNDLLENMTLFFKFETSHELRNEFKVVHDGSFVNFVFETDSFEKGLKHVLEYSFDFSKSFHSEEDSHQPLESIPHRLPKDGKIIFLKEKYWYYLISIGTYHEFMIVESPTNCGFESVFKKGDVVIKKIIVISKQLPFVRDNGEGNYFIVSMDAGFEPFQILLPSEVPSDVLTLAQSSSRVTFP